MTLVWNVTFQRARAKSERICLVERGNLQVNFVTSPILLLPPLFYLLGHLRLLHLRLRLQGCEDEGAEDGVRRNQGADADLERHFDHIESLRT